ncbi:DUF4271 domain-containing protein [Dysgonomonas macrotermitis]|uniref:DUF4271 domain-containing protein n=1 Tax=Dysgonomonas macrotermitis TaxID=1346286 RepID=A0A1M5GZR6_9BACT|nr:DUF4271 domain-containing protein [Dysgonomonas macrotermitis]SHG09249.1 protein of unknown function [Dysgonomonas macrotermitis]
MESGESTYVIDSVALARSYKDSVEYRSLLKIEKDTSMYFTEDKWQSLHTAESRKEFQNNGHLGIHKDFALENEDGVLVLLLICFLFFTRIYKGGITFFRENTRLLFSYRENSNLFSETTITEFWFNFILLFQNVLLTSIIIFDIFLESDNNPLPKDSFATILVFIVIIALFISIKSLFYRFIGYVFDMKEYTNMWQRTYIIVLEMTGMIAFVPTLMMIYSQKFHFVLIIFFISLFIISRLILFYRIITFFLRQPVNFLFLIVYLCSVEIIPYILLYQVLIFLYKVDLISLLWL